jgi:hypothetical protein
VANLVEHYCAAGLKLVLAQRLEDAEAAFRAALAMEPGHPRSQWGLAHTLLGMGRYAEGWPLLRARFQVAEGDVKPASRQHPEWRGESLADKTLAVTFEQGFGDQIMLSRFLPQIRASGARVLLVVRQPLVRLLRPLADDVVAIELGKSVATPPYHYWTHFFSLPERLSITLESLPCAPYLAASAGRSSGAGGRIGLFWRTADENRSLPNALAQRLLGRGMISLQPEDTGAADFAETAAIVEALDLVVTIDTAMAHLAGAMGKAVWVLLPAHGLDWRWLRERSDSPWYPSARLFRQVEPGGWGEVVQQVEAALP